MGKACPKCAYERQPSDVAPDYACPSCGLVYAKFDPALEARQRQLRARTSGDWSGVPFSEIPLAHRAQAAQAVPITTTNEIPGRVTLQALDVVSAECAYGMNIFKDLLAGVTDALGGRSGFTQGVLKDASRVVMAQLRLEALQLGADAVVGVRLDYNEFSGAGKSMLFVVATGTAVKLAP